MTLSSVQALSASVHARYEIKYSLKGCAHTLSDRTATLVYYKGAVSNFWEAMLKVGQTKHQNTLVANQK